MDIPHQRLAPETLNSLIEEFVSREGTDYGHRDFSLADKVRQVRRQLENGQAAIVYDAETQSCHIVAVQAPGTQDAAGGEPT